MKLFVYGTLRPRASHGLTWRSLGAARLRGRLYDFGDFPGAVLDPAAPDFVHGEVIEGGNAAQLARLDAYEGAQFRRDRVAVRTDDGREHACWVWVLAREPESAPRIPDGVWRDAD